MGLQWPNLSLCDSPQCVNDGQLRLQTRRLIEEAHHKLYHLRYGLLQLRMLLGQNLNVLVHKVPIARILAQCDDSLKQARCRGQV